MISRAPKVSVIVPVHNTAPYLRQCLDSIINQSFKDTEIICVDNESTDDSPSILDEYASKDPRIRILNQPTGGAAAARNLGIESACGEYLAIFDSDDFFARETLEKTYQKAKRTHADIVLFGGHYYDSATRQPDKWFHFISTHQLPTRNVFSAHSIPNTIFQVTNPAAWNKLFKRSLIQDYHIRFQDLPNSNDVFFTYSALAVASRVTHLLRPYIFYRYNTGKGTQDKRHLNPCCFLDALNALRDFLQAKGLFDLLEQSYVTLAQHLLRWNIETVQTEESRFKILDYLSHHSALLNSFFNEGDTASDSAENLRTVAKIKRQEESSPFDPPGAVWKNRLSVRLWAFPLYRALRRHFR